MGSKRKTKIRGSFVSKLQRRPKIKAIRKKIREADRKRKQLSNEYRRLLKSEAKKVK